MEASVFGGETFSISTEDVKSVTDVLAALENHKEEGDDENPIEEILKNMPKEIKSLLGAAIVVSKLRRKGEDN